MSRFPMRFSMFAAFAALSTLSPALAQTATSAAPPLAAHVIVPQARSFALDRSAAIEITGVTVGVVIVDQVATTTMEVALRNTGPQRVEGELAVPVPTGAVVRSFAFEGSAAEPVARLLPKEEARRTYDAIVAKVRDPALLEFAGDCLIRSSIFPIAAGGTQKVRLTYEQVLPRDGQRVDYELPRSESLEYKVPWSITVRIEAPTPIATVYSPSHELQTIRSGAKVVSVRLRTESQMAPGPFRLAWLLSGDDVSASLLAYPDGTTDGGYFLLLAGLPAHSTATGAETTVRREVTLVIDHSGSMNGNKLEQARAAVLQVLAGLDEGEWFNIIAYNDLVTPFAARPVRKNAETERDAQIFMAKLQAVGSTNLYQALAEALRPTVTEATLPLVLFLTDGLPTVGNTSEVAIRNLALQHNAANRRIFTFGVGADVNTPLLQKIADATRARATFVLPSEDVEVKVAQVFKGLEGPVLTDPVLAAAGDDTATATARVSEMLPAALPDFFADDQLVVLGRYRGTAPLHFTLRGSFRGQPRTFKFVFPLDHATTRNAFVPRLWASRRIAVLVDAIRQMGADASPPRPGTPASADPRLKELTDEIVRLGTDYGILTEYTAFLANEGTDLSKRDAVLAQASANFQNRAMQTRSGVGSLNQTMNNDAQMRQQTLNYANAQYDANMNRVAIANVQQVADRAFYQRGGRWVDSQVVERERDIKPARVVVVGSPEFQALADRLTAENRAGCVALRGEILIMIDGQPVLIKSPAGAE